MKQKTNLWLYLLLLVVLTPFASAVFDVTSTNPATGSYTTQTNPNFYGYVVGNESTYTMSLQIANSSTGNFFNCGTYAVTNGTVTSITSNNTCTFTLNGNTYYWKLNATVGTPAQYNVSTARSLKYVSGINLATEVAGEIPSVFGALLNMIIGLAALPIVWALVTGFVVLIASLTTLMTKKTGKL